MATHQEEPVPKTIEAGSAKTASPTDPVLLEVLLDIRASLQRLEVQLVSNRQSQV
jgi:hypothetical protein